MKIKWINRFSLQEGYVREVVEDHFINTFDKAEARKFKSRRDAEKMIEKLFDYGEGLNNEFQVIANN